MADDRLVLERICLEGFQSGLSWITILRKRSAFRRAFRDFEPALVAQFGERDVSRLLQDRAIVRHPGKIRAAVANARATLRLQDAGQSLAKLCWDHEPAPVPPPRTMADIHQSIPESAALARELKRRGFGFVGAVSAYSLMQSLGLVNDHLADCPVRPQVEHQRQGFPRP